MKGSNQHYPMILERGLRAHAERTFIEMVQAALAGVEGFEWHPDPDMAKVQVLSSKSHDDLEYLPRIIVSVGDISEFKGAVDHLKSWTAPAQKYAYVDQCYLLISVYSDVAQEAADLAYYLRRSLRMARHDLGRRGIFGVQNVQVTDPVPNQHGTKRDYLFGSNLQAGFLIISGEQVEQGDNLSLVERFGGEIRVNHAKLGVGTDDPVAPERAYVDNEDRILIEFNGRLGSYQPTGVHVMVDGRKLKAPVVRDINNFRRLIAEPFKLHKHMIVSYKEGDLVDLAGQPVAPFEMEVEH